MKYAVSDKYRLMPDPHTKRTSRVPGGMKKFEIALTKPAQMVIIYLKIDLETGKTYAIAKQLAAQPRNRSREPHGAARYRTGPFPEVFGLGLMRDDRRLWKHLLEGANTADMIVMRVRDNYIAQPCAAGAGRQRIDKPLQPAAKAAINYCSFAA